MSVEIEYLEKIGSPLNFKTFKQGRRINLSELKWTPPVITSKGTNKEYIAGDFINMNKVRVTCSTILKHRWPTEKEKAKALDLVKKYSFTPMEIRIIYSIAKRLRHRK